MVAARRTKRWSISIPRTETECDIHGSPCRVQRPPFVTVAVGMWSRACSSWWSCECVHAPFLCLPQSGCCVTLKLVSDMVDVGTGLPSLLDSSRDEGSQRTGGTSASPASAPASSSAAASQSPTVAPFPPAASVQSGPSSRSRVISVDDCFNAINSLHATVTTLTAENKAARESAAESTMLMKRTKDELQVEQRVAKKLRLVTEVFDHNPEIDNEIAPYRHVGECFAEAAKQTEMAAIWIAEHAPGAPGADATIQGLHSATDRCTHGASTALLTAQSIRVGASMQAPRSFVASVAVDSATADVPGFAAAGGVPKSVSTAFATFKKDRDQETKRGRFASKPSVTPDAKKSDALPTTPCPKCQQPGHWKRNCPLLQASPAVAAKQT